MKPIAGINRPVRGGMAVLKPFDVAAHSPDGYMFTRWLAGLPWWTPLVMLLIIALYPSIAYAQSAFTTSDAFGALWRWMPFLLGSGFLFNVLISFWAMLIGTLAGAALGLGPWALDKSLRLGLCAPFVGSSRNSFAIHHGW